MEKEVIICRRCHSENVTPEYRSERDQIGIKCHNCNAYTWQPKEGSKNRESKNKHLVKAKCIDYCEWCLRKKDNLIHPDELIGHHIIEYKDGGLGKDDLSNVLVLCTSCHRLCHWCRTYLNRNKIL